MGAQLDQCKRGMMAARQTVMTDNSVPDAFQTH
jgi:hypothetical protein